MQSCNDAIMQMAAMIGSERFVKYQEIFGFGAKTGIDLPGEADTSTLVYHADDMGAADLATNAFGQNYNCTMIQMAAAYCSVINGGSYYEPHVVKQILNESGSVVKKVEPNLVRETVSESTAQFIREALYDTVAEGTGSAAQVTGYKVGGKTGTAEKYPRGNGNYVVSFAGFAPTDDPQVLVYVVIDTPHVEDQPHSSYASNIVQKILSEILPYMNVFPDTAAIQVPEDVQAQLPQEEGISAGDNDAIAPEETEAETKVYETDEYVEQDGEASGIPEAIPGMESQEGQTAGESGTQVPEGSSEADSTADPEETAPASSEGDPAPADSSGTNDTEAGTDAAETLSQE